MSNWREELNNSIDTIEQLGQYIDLTPEERQGIERIRNIFNWGVSPYYASLMARDEPSCPVRRQVVPTVDELQDDLGIWDPLREVDNSPVENLIHVYPDRVAFCISSRCATFCRFCLRKRTVDTKGTFIDEDNFTQGIDYLRSQRNIRDVLLTGGDPLLMPDESLPCGT